MRPHPWSLETICPSERGGLTQKLTATKRQVKNIGGELPREVILMRKVAVNICVAKNFEWEKQSSTATSRPRFLCICNYRYGPYSLMQRGE